MQRLAAIGLLLFLLSSAAIAQEAIPTPESFLGYPLGDRFTPHHRILEYLAELARRSPLISVQTFGQSYEGRPLTLAILTAEKHRSALETIRKNVATLARGEALDPARLASITATTPAVVWLAYGIHGNESSSAEAAMRVAATLVRDPEATRLLDDLVVIIDPLQNPDGRERYIQWFHRTRGAQANPNADSFEHHEPWPGGRFNHYLIDMNRDWAWMSQRETQARVAMVRQWNPQVFVDLHEMGFQSTYFFPPGAKPINSNVPRDIERWLDTFGRANAAEFSKRNWPFFVSESFDLFYPGYGDSWPSLRGAIGMTYESAGHSRAGTIVEREDGTLLTLADRIERHSTSSMTTLRTAAANREALLRYTQAAAAAQMEGTRQTYIIERQSPNAAALIDILLRQGIDVQQTSTSSSIRVTPLAGDSIETRLFEAGTAVVSTRQPLGALAQTLLERNPSLPKNFLEEQRKKAEADEADDFYDLTAWSLPLAMNVEAFQTTAPITSALEPYQKAPAPAFRRAAFGYLVDGEDPNLYRFVGLLLREGIRFGVSDSDLAIGERTFARGSLVILQGSNRGSDLDARLGRAVQTTGVTVVPLESGWMGGTALGSERIRFVKDPKIALVGGPGTSSTSFGMLWHTLDIDTPIPHSVLSLDALRTIDLERYEVVVFPDGDYTDRMPKRITEKLQNWIRGGGTVIAIGGASSYLRAKDVEISKLKPWEPPKKKEEEPPADERYHDFRIPGSAFRTSMNHRSYLTFGVPRAPTVLVAGSRAFLPVAHRVDNIVTIDAKNPLVAGVAWPESIERLKGSVYLVTESYGRGSVITFVDDPHFRLFWRGTLPLFLNAVIYSPSFLR